MVGAMSASYIIEQLNMHQIAYIDSEFVMPSVIYIGGKLRHPFRLYANDVGNVCVLVCDVPIMNTGIHSVLNTVVNWAKKFGVKEIMVLDGIPSAATVTSEGTLIMSTTPDSNRKPLILSNDGKTVADNGFIRYMRSIDEKNDNDNNGDNNKLFDDVALITGISGGLLAASLSNGIACKGLLISTTSSTSIPDPEGAAILVEAINNMGNDSLKIDVQKLREKGENLKRKMEELIKKIPKQQQQSMPLNER